MVVVLVNFRTPIAQGAWQVNKSILLVLVLILAACSPQSDSDETPEVANTQVSSSAIQPESTPDIIFNVDMLEISIADIRLIEDSFTAATRYGDASFGEAIFEEKCASCLILPDSIVTSESDLSTIFAKAIYYANGDISPEGYLFNSIQENEWNTLTQNETYHVIAYMKSLYDSDIDSVVVASLATPEPEATVVVEADEDNSESSDEVAENPSDETENPFVIAVANADPIAGEQSFTMNFVTPCNTCHVVDSENMLVGPGLLNISERAGSRIEGITAEEYLYNSIVNPNDFVVDGFSPAMPANYGDSLTDDEIYNLVAYLMTLGQ